jgi:hypothetical protein
VKTQFRFALAALALMAGTAQASAWEDGGGGPFGWLYHRYGDDMYRPALTPDRPYWHGDAAVPPSERWHDRDIEVVDEYGITVGTRAPPPETVEVEATVMAAPVVSPTRRHPVRRHRTVIRARRLCPPVATAYTDARPALQLPPVPAPTEH